MYIDPEAMLDPVISSARKEAEQLATNIDIASIKKDKNNLIADPDVYDLTCGRHTPFRWRSAAKQKDAALRQKLLLHLYITDQYIKDDIAYRLSGATPEEVWSTMLPLILA